MWNILPFVAGGILLLAGLDQRLITRHYMVRSEKLTAPVRIAVVSDLHGETYGEGQRKLLDAVARESPDLIMMPGDMVDDSIPPERSYMTMKALAQRYPCYYVTGNHEIWTGDVDGVKDKIRSLGVHVLEGTGVSIVCKGQTLHICGLDDPSIRYLYQDFPKIDLERNRTPGAFSILLAHRPDRIARYRRYRCDLVLCGHAHGGQWRIPGLINGVYAPNQGIFPKYAGGKYRLEDSTMVVSRGLSRTSTRIPRIFNRPELVLVEVGP